MKKYAIKTERVSYRGDRPRSENVQIGTLEELTQYFGYTLQVGYSYNNKIKRFPKTIKSLVSNLNKSYEEQEGGYTKTHAVQITLQEAEDFQKNNP